MRKKKHEAFLNAYLAENLGDDLFLHVIANRYKCTKFYVLASSSYKGDLPSNICYDLSKFDEQLIEIENKILFFLNSHNLPARRLLPKGIRVLYRKRNYLSRKYGCNIFVIGSGFMERGKLIKNELRTDSAYFSRNVHLLGCNFGPYQSETFRAEYEKIFSKTAEVCFRDTYSYGLFEKLNNVRYESDIVFSFNEEVPNYFEDDRKYIVISVVNLEKDGDVQNNSLSYYKLLADIAEWYLHQNIEVVFVGFCRQQGDDRTIGIISAMIPSNRIKLMHVVNYPDRDIHTILGLFKNADAVFASRYHAGIIGMLFKRKTYFLAYSDKTINVLHDIDPHIKFIDVNAKVTITAEKFIADYGYSISDIKLKELIESANRQFMILDEVLD